MFSFQITTGINIEMIRLSDCSYAADYKQIDLKMQGKYDNLITH